ncbi:MAG: hypothetical protein GXN93_05265 [Candidatus Diapherotrites archaeon]|nr:hypothetical protein [Candidatus Diapherotrites archaeon]
MRGSVALEFLLVLLAVTMYAGVVLTAAQTISTGVAEDMSKMTRARVAMDKIYNAVQFLSAGADGSSTTVVVYVPTGARLILSGDTVEANVSVDGNYASVPSCTSKYCIFRIAHLPLSFDNTYTYTGGVYRTITLTNSSGQVKVS